MASRILLAGVATAVFACGGTAIIDPVSDGTGGAGGTVSVTVTSSTSGPVAVTVVSSTSSGMMDSFCEQACESLANCTTELPNCVDRCESVSPACREAHQRWMSCSLGETNTMCGFGPGTICQPDLLEYLECSGLMAEETCQGGPDECLCTAFIPPGVLLEQECGPDGCRCSYGDAPFGFCEPQEAICGVFAGCCAGIFFTAPVN